MRILFVDTNVLIDFLADRRPFSISAAKLFNYALLKKVKIYVSATSYNNIYYILRQSLPHKESIDLLTELSEMTETVDVTKNIIDTSMKSSSRDFEDAIQYNCAFTISKMEIIVTRNTKDYKKSVLPVMTAEEMVSLLESAGR
jgi:predicted nucleic acid-binding protein